MPFATVGGILPGDLPTDGSVLLDIDNMPNRVHPADRDAYLTALGAALAMRRPGVSLHVRLPLGGRWRCATQVIEFVYGGLGQLSSVLSVLTDIDPGDAPACCCGRNDGGAVGAPAPARIDFIGGGAIKIYMRASGELSTEDAATGVVGALTKRFVDFAMRSGAPVPPLPVCLRDRVACDATPPRYSYARGDDDNEGFTLGAFEVEDVSVALKSSANGVGIAASTELWADIGRSSADLLPWSPTAAAGAVSDEGDYHDVTNGDVAEALGYAFQPRRRRSVCASVADARAWIAAARVQMDACMTGTSALRPWARLSLPELSLPMSPDAKRAFSAAVLASATRRNIASAS